MSHDEKPNITYSVLHARSMHFVFCLIVCFFVKDIGGNDIQKQEIREAVELPLTHFDLYKQIGEQLPIREMRSPEPPLSC